MSDRVELYSLPISHYCVSVERMLAFKGIRWRSIYAPYHDREALLRRTGQDYVPTLLWNGRVVSWTNIPEFLERQVPEPTLYPSGRRALARALENWGHQVLEERVWRAVVTRVPPLLKTEHERWVFEEMQTRARGPWHILRQREAEFRRELAPYLGLVNDLLVGREWILDEASIADFGIYGSLSPWWTVGGRIPTSLHPLAAWARRIGRLGA
ncbi:MAG: glutathione S-transferase N-terminal domain-containing protein [Thermoplasmata archaeon]